MSARTTEPALAETRPPQAFGCVVRHVGLPSSPADLAVVTESDLAPLPQAAQGMWVPRTVSHALTWAFADTGAHRRRSGWA
jgi:hypothetical protein